jgi:hypothetical protein
MYAFAFCYALTLHYTIMCLLHNKLNSACVVYAQRAKRVSLDGEITHTHDTCERTLTCISLFLTQRTITAHVLHTHYSAPKGFDWEERSPTVSGGNVAQRAAVFVSKYWYVCLVLFVLLSLCCFVFRMGLIWGKDRLLMLAAATLHSALLFFSK